MFPPIHCPTDDADLHRFYFLVSKYLWKSVKSVGFFAFSQILGIVWENHFALVTICFSMCYKSPSFKM